MPFSLDIGGTPLPQRSLFPVGIISLEAVESLKDGAFPVYVSCAPISKGSCELPDPINELICSRNAVYVVTREAVPYLEALMPWHRRGLTINERYSFGRDLLAEIFGGKGEKCVSSIRHEILGCVGRRHGIIGLNNTGLAIFRFGKDAKHKLWGGYIL